MRLYKTEKGQAAFKLRSPLFSARQRSLFLLLDGKKTAVEVLAATAGLGASQADVDYLLSMEFLSAQADSALPPSDATPLEATGTRDAAMPVVAARPPQQRYLEAKPIATQLTASLGLRGFLLNLAVESASGYDELLQLLPRLQGALGAKACRKLERALLE
jgi:hypothetical protein